MAIVKCKECGEKVSNKAEACPKCGAKMPKKTSLFTWLMTFLIILIIYIALQETPTSQNKTQAQKKPSWGSDTSRDKMTGKLSAYAQSPNATPSKRMSFPYNNVNSWMGVGCDSSSEWAYFGFNISPNLTNDETENGYNTIKTRLKWDGKVEEVSLTQKWGAEFIHFRDNEDAISKIASSNKALLELHWHGEQTIYFEYSLKGSSKAISKIRSLCKSYK